MKICFSGLSNAITIDSKSVSVFEVHNRALFSRICNSLYLESGLDAVEPYTIWSDVGQELHVRGQYLMIGNPMELPWGHKLLYGAVLARIESLAQEQEMAISMLEEQYRKLRAEFYGLIAQLQSDYALEVELDMKKCLKSFGFRLDVSSQDKLLDKLIAFFALIRDAQFKKAIIFVNLKLFLTKNELVQLYERALFSGISLLLVENIGDDNLVEKERKYVIDQDFLECWPGT